MEEIIQLITENPSEAISKLLANQKTASEIDALRAEFVEMKRDIRTTQVGLKQKDSYTGEGEERRLVTKVRIPIAFQNDIVEKSVAFEIGNPPGIYADEQNDLSDEVDNVITGSRIHQKMMKALVLTKSELQSALLFYIENIKENKKKNFFARIFRSDQEKEIKCKILKNEDGIMAPYFDSMGDMKAFTWQFKTGLEGDNQQEHTWVYTEDYCYKFISGTIGWQLETKEKHGFDKIPVVYMEQDQPEWFRVIDMIDRYEVAVSRHGDANDYSGHPILKIFGQVDGAPSKDDEGKAFTMAMEKDEDGKVEKMGDVDFLTYAQAPESVDLEFKTLERLIHNISSTPDLSFDNLKGLGNVAGVALRLMFLDAEIKANTKNESINRTNYQRVIAIIVSGILTTTGKGLKKHENETRFQINFNSIIPDDVKTTVETLTGAVSGKIMSIRTAVKELNRVEDVDEEVENIKNESTITAPAQPTTPSGGDGE